MKLHIFHTGSVRVDKAVPLYENNPLAATGFLRGSDKQMLLPVSVYLIEHEKGRILIDTGWHSKYVNDKSREFFGIVNKVSKPIIKEGESIDCRLKEHGVSAMDIDYVLFSHLDFDHVSGTELVKDAKMFMASEEVAAAKKSHFRYMKDNWSMVDLNTFKFQETGIGPVGKSFDLFNDGTIKLISTPGHSYGHFSVKLTGKDGKYIIIGGDVAYLPESFSKQIIPGITVDKKLAKQSLKWLTNCKDDSLCMGVFANYDHSVSEQVVEI